MYIERDSHPPDVNQVAKIVEILGSPSEDEIEKIQSEPAKRYLRQLGKNPGVPFEKLFPKATPLGSQVTLSHHSD